MKMKIVKQNSPINKNISIDQKFKIIELGKKVIEIEVQSIMDMIPKIDYSFVKAVNILYRCTGRIIVTGIGKSGLIGKKIASTFSSTGSPAYFLHPAEGGHGDVGILLKGDVIIAISKSGTTKEVNLLIPYFKRLKIPLISMVGDSESQLAKASDVILSTYVKKEACPMDLAPTSSTTVSLVLGDALAMTLLELKGFSSKDFAFLHPEGTLGKMLLFRVKDIMQAGSQIGVVSENIKLHDSILEMTAKRGILIVVNEYGILTGVFTYGDLGRLIKEKPTCFEYQMGDIMVKNPKVISQDQLAVFAVKLMGKYKITALVVVDRERKPIGIIHLHDCMEHGIKIM